MVSLWILNKKISGSIVSASRHAIREAPFQHAATEWPCTPSLSLTEKTASSKTKRQKNTKHVILYFGGTPLMCWEFTTASHLQEKKIKKNRPLLPERLAWSGYGVMVWEDWMNVAICVGNIEMLDNSPSGFTEPNHPCGQHAAAPVNLTLIIPTQSSWSGHTQLVSQLHTFYLV